MLMDELDGTKDGLTQSNIAEESDVLVSKANVSAQRDDCGSETVLH